ncbi:hypothetical protein [Pseudotabrizicola sp. L79]|uniref:hypothetical protein n=1 Tax=Pseudotabrizicola sp. L79 TaxID=3118402 RepID=UPI002F939E8E
MAATLTLALAAAGCVQTAPRAPGPVAAVPLRVTNNGAAFANHQGAAARRVAAAECAGQGKVLRSSIYDRFEAGAWVFVEGCV